MTQPEEHRETLNIGEYVWLLRQGRWIILGFVVVSLLVSILITVRTQPVYQSGATFIYDFSSSMSQAFDFPGVLWFEIDSAKNNQIQIIRSRSMAEAVADSILRSPDSDSITTLLYNGYPPAPPVLRSSLVSLVSGSISVSVMKDTDFFILSAIGPSPEASAVLANIVVQTYYRRNLEEVRGENREIRVFLEEQLATMEQQLASDEDSLRRFKEANGLIDLTTEARETVMRLTSLMTAAAEARTLIGAMEARRAYLSSILDGYRTGMAEELAGINNTLVNTLLAEIGMLESARASLLADGYEVGDPALEDIERQIEAKTDALSAALAGVAAASFPSDPPAAVQGLVGQMVEVEAGLRAERTRESILAGQSRLVESELSTLPSEEMVLARLERNRSVSENVYLLLRTRYEEIRIAEAGQIGNVTIVDTALPGGQIRPSRQKNLIMGLLVGLSLGIGVVLLREQLDTSISSPEQVEAMGVPILGVIPKMRKTLFTRTAPGTVSTALVTHHSPRDPISEAYRDLRTSLSFSRTDSPLKTILVTSAGPREGKSTTSSNLAAAFAQSGRRCLLVDADLRRPVIHNLFGVAREPGLSELVAGQAPLERCLRRTSVENLEVIPCGFIPHNPSELLGSRRMKDLLAELGGRWDTVLVDTPPMAVVTDALILSPEVDGTLLVVGARLGSRRVVQTTLGKLSRTSAFLAGAVLNGFDPLRMYTSYGYYTYRYYYYYSDGKRKRGATGRRAGTEG